MSDSAAAKQINTLFYIIGKAAKTMLASTNITKEERKLYNTVINKFDSYFKVIRNIIFAQESKR